MLDLVLSTVQTNLQLILLTSVPILCAIIVYNWKRRGLYWHSAKIPGPFAVPLLGCINLITTRPQGVYKLLTKLYKEYPTVVRLWIANDLYVSTTNPQHLKMIMNKFLDKGDFYHLMSQYFQRALAAAPVDLWKKTRKNINPTFNVGLIHTFGDAFAKHANSLAENLEEFCGKESDDLYPIVWKCTLDAGCETLSEVDPNLLKTEEFLPIVFRIEEIIMQRFFNPIFHLNFFWNLSPLKRELIALWKANCDFIQKIIDMKTSPNSNAVEENSTKKRFLDQLVDLEKKQQVPDHSYVLEEAQIMYFVGTETSAAAISTTLLVLGMYPNIQDKIDEELFSVFGTSARDPTLDDINSLEYLERVIKETLRLFPPIPFIMRKIEQDIPLGSYVFPAGAKLIVPLMAVHRNPEFWPDPLNFDPDRFLPEEVEKRPPCAFIPFSYGIRNCIGNKYGLLSMKFILSTVLRRYRVLSSNYKNIEDLDFFVHVIAKPKDGYKVILQRK